MKTKSNKQRNWAVIIIALAMSLLGAWYFYFWTNQNNTDDNINSFDECVAVGYPVMESYPEQCNADGKHFVRDISN